MCWFKRVGKKNGAVEGIVDGGIDGVGGEEYSHQNQGIDPGVFEGHVFPSSKQILCFPPLGVHAGDFGIGVSLQRLESVLNFISSTENDTHWCELGRGDCRHRVQR